MQRCSNSRRADPDALAALRHGAVSLPGFLTLCQAEPTGAVRKFLATVLDAIAGSSVQLVAPCAAAAICLLRVRLRAALKPTAVCVSSHATRVALPCGVRSHRRTRKLPL